MPEPAKSSLAPSSFSTLSAGIASRRSSWCRTVTSPGRSETRRNSMRYVNAPACSPFTSTHSASESGSASSARTSRTFARASSVMVRISLMHVMIGPCRARSSCCPPARTALPTSSRRRHIWASRWSSAPRRPQTLAGSHGRPRRRRAPAELRRRARRDPRPPPPVTDRRGGRGRRPRADRRHCRGRTPRLPAQRRRRGRRHPRQGRDATRARGRRRAPTALRRARDARPDHRRAARVRSGSRRS